MTAKPVGLEGVWPITPTPFDEEERIDPQSLERVVRFDPTYDFHRAAALLAHALGRIGETERAAKLFEEVTRISTLSETQYNYARFLAAQGRTNEAREWAQRVLAKKPTMPGYLKRRERPWFRRAEALMRQRRSAPAASG